jgi:hypothetical protein
MIVSTKSAGVSAPRQVHPLTTALAGFVTATRFEDLPPEAIHGTKSLLENSGGGWVSIGALAARRRVMTMIMAW